MIEIKNLNSPKNNVPEPQVAYQGYVVIRWRSSVKAVLIGIAKMFGTNAKII